jgi:hypothetical protein
MTTCLSRLRIPLLVTAAFVFGVVELMPAARAARTQPFTEAEIFFELNDTDGDLGIHASIDGEPWTALEIEGPGGRELLDMVSRGRLRTQGLTQLSLESAEPAFDELAPADFLVTIYLTHQTEAGILSAWSPKTALPTHCWALSLTSRTLKPASRLSPRFGGPTAPNARAVALGRTPAIA